MLVPLLCCILAGALLFSGCTDTPGPAAGPPYDAETARLVAFVHEAREYAQREGREAALASFNDPHGSFVREDLYIFAYDYNGTTLALPLQPGLIGTSRWDTQDPDGVFFIRELALAAQDGSGFVRYRYMNPAQDSIVQEKLSYVVGVDDTWWLGSGIYQDG